ncbi:MAG: GIY-YIG nuclease family protein [Patescibacteria group bacterium]
MYTVYILKSLIIKKSYVGLTNDLTRRLGEHNSGKSVFTNKYKPWEVIYTEEVGTLQEARKREKYLKSSSGRSRVLKPLFRDLEV